MIFHVILKIWNSKLFKYCCNTKAKTINKYTMILKDSEILGNFQYSLPQIPKISRNWFQEILGENVDRIWRYSRFRINFQENLETRFLNQFSKKSVKLVTKPWKISTGISRKILQRNSREFHREISGEILQSYKTWRIWENSLLLLC